MNDISRFKKDIEWKSYSAVQGNSGVVRYAVGEDFILIVFRQREEVYVYTDHATGKTNVDEMKKLAVEGKGLSSFISKKRAVDYACTLPLVFFD